MGKKVDSFIFHSISMKIDLGNFQVWKRKCIYIKKKSSTWMFPCWIYWFDTCVKYVVVVVFSSKYRSVDGHKLIDSLPPTSYSCFEVGAAIRACVSVCVCVFRDFKVILNSSNGMLFIEHTINTIDLITL